MARKISKEEIRVGDKIRVTDSREVVVEHVRPTMIEGSDAYALFFDAVKPWVRSFELLERPNPPLPTAPGSVVRVSNGISSTNWLLHHGEEWTSALGIRKSPSELVRFADDRGLTLEVIA